jgi:rhodanese-related sulfurtransferase
MRIWQGILALGVAITMASPALAQQEGAIEAMQDYLMFAEETAGIILPQQIDRTVFDNALFVDTRSAAQHAEATIPGAIHIEWREVLDRIDEIPDNRMTILFCNTGARSSQATFALRVAGRTNVVVMQSGFDGWQRDAAYHP